MAEILIIDDEPHMVQAVARTLRRAGHVVHEATGGREGIALFRKTKPDLVICDIVMPDREGLETIIELRREAPVVPILAISGDIAKSLWLRSATLLGATATLEKPFRPEQLSAAVAGLLGETTT